jgi:hypothetical protein
MKTLGQQLKEENEAREAEIIRQQRERELLENEVAKSEASILFDEMIKGLPDVIKEANRDGKKSLKVISADWNNRFHFTKTQIHLMWKLEQWAKENDLASFRSAYDRLMIELFIWIYVVGFVILVIAKILGWFLDD